MIDPDDKVDPNLDDTIDPESDVSVDPSQYDTIDPEEGIEPHKKADPDETWEES